MPKDIRNKLSDLSLQPRKTRPTKAKKTRSSSKYLLYEEWAYGYHLKNRHLRLLAEKYNLPWQKNPVRVMFRLSDFFKRATDVYYKTTPVVYRGKAAQIVTFLKDDGRKRLELNKFSQEDMEKMRDIIGIPAGTKPKWFDVSDNDSGAEFSSDDEEFPLTEFPKLTYRVTNSGNDYENRSSPYNSSEDSSCEDEESDESSDEDEDDEDENEDAENSEASHRDKEHEE